MSKGKVVLVVMFGLLFFFLGIAGSVEQLGLAHGRGEVLSVRQVGLKKWTATVRFTTAAGEVVTEEVGPAGSQPRPGDQVELRYKPDDPSFVMYPDFRWVVFLFPLIGFGLAIGYPAWLVVRKYRAPRSSAAR